MYPKKDLRSTRLEKGLSAKDLCLGSIIRPATISQIERGKIVPRKSTRLLIEGVIGPVDWVATYAGRDRQHLVFFLQEFLNLEGEGDPMEKIIFTRQTLKLIAETQKI